MQDAITNVINQADVQGLYLDGSAMGRLEQYFASGELRVRAAATISANASAIIKQAVAKSLLYSDITRPGGNMYTTRRYAACIRDLDYYLRLVTYGIIAGDVTPIEEIGIIGAKEMYRSLGTPLEAMAEAVREMKNAAMGLLTGADAEEAGFYFDYVVGALS
jgi:allophycocyanin beta subunit